MCQNITARFFCCERTVKISFFVLLVASYVILMSNFTHIVSERSKQMNFKYLFRRKRMKMQYKHVFNFFSVLFFILLQIWLD